MVRPVYSPHGLGVYAARAVKQAVRARAGLRGAPHPHAGRGRGDPRERRRRRRHPRARADRRRGLGREGPRRARGRDPRLHRLQPGLLRQPAPEPSGGLRHQSGGGPRRHARARQLGPAARRASASWWSAAGRPGWKPPGWRRRAATACGCSSASACWAARSGSPRGLPGRAELADFADWRAAECARRGVDIELGVDASADAVLALAPDAVIVATGGRATVRGLAKWWSMPVPGSEQGFVIDHERAQREQASLGPRVVIFDVVGHIEGPGLAELLASRGLEVTLVSPLAQPMLLDAETLVHALARACRAGARWCPTTGLAAIGEREVTLVNLLSGKTERVETGRPGGDPHARAARGRALPRAAGTHRSDPRGGRRGGAQRRSRHLRRTPGGAQALRADRPPADPAPRAAATLGRGMAGFHFQELFELGEDSTPYRKLGRGLRPGGSRGRARDPPGRARGAACGSRRRPSTTSRICCAPATSRSCARSSTTRRRPPTTASSRSSC